MPGVTKHIFEHDIRDILAMWNKQIETIQPLLPRIYSKSHIIELLKEFYPYEWEYVEKKYIYYQIKDKYIKRKFGKARYKMKKPESLLFDSSGFKKIFLDTYQQAHYDNYIEKSCNEERKKLTEKRKPKIERVKLKIEKALAKTQQITPAFIDQLIGLYKRKNTSQKDRMYILFELKKYYSDKIIQFFFKLNDTELNMQLRFAVFYHLQEFGYQPRLRKQQYMQVHVINKNRKNF